MAAVADDPTMDLIASLDDPTKFVRKDSVSVFKPHVRHFPERKIGDKVVPAMTVKVTDDDLEEIAENTNRAYQAEGELVKLSIGHRKMLPDYPEDKQPRVVGYARGYKAVVVNRPGGKAIRLTHTEYIRADATDVLSGQYPQRSPDYDPFEKKITGVALLTRDPALELGTVSYQSGKLAYSMEPTMADPKDDEKDDEKQYAKMCAYMKKKYPRLAQYMDEPGATNTDTPKFDYQKDPAIDAKVKELEDKLAAEQKARVEESCKRLLEPLRSAVKFNYERELKVLCQYASDAERTAHADDMLANREKLPTGKMIPVGNVPKPGSVNDPLTQEEFGRALAYQSEKSVDWEAAMVHVKSLRK